MSIRITGTGTSYYHCISRVVDRRFVFQADEKEVFRSILRKLEAFTGVKVVTYCVMGNHFHLLLMVPDRQMLAPLNAERLLELLPLLIEPADWAGIERGIRQRAQLLEAVLAAAERSRALA